jgi:5-methylcytosine-specific restriction protein A
MPTMPPHRCSTCGALVTGRCPDCRQQREQRRPNAAQRGYLSPRWRELRARKLRHDPCCSACLLAGRRVPATEVDHRERHDGPNDPRFWLWDNLNSLCKRCHSSKTARQDSAFLTHNRS